MESIIRWETGTPARGGLYLVVVGDGIVTYDQWAYDSFHGKME